MRRVLFGKTHILLSFVVCLLMAGNLSPMSVFAQAGDPPDYILGPGDALLISVWREETLTRTVTVRPDGKISFPLVQEIRVSGLTPLQLRDMIEERLRKYVQNPNVSVVVTEYNSFKIYIIGEVGRPGMYQLKSPTTLLQALSLAGGFRDFASPNKTKVIRKGPKGREVISVKVNDIMGGEADKDIPLKPDDTIVVP